MFFLPIVYISSVSIFIIPHQYSIIGSIAVDKDSPLVNYIDARFIACLGGRMSKKGEGKKDKNSSIGASSDADNQSGALALIERISNVSKMIELRNHDAEGGVVELGEFLEQLQSFVNGMVSEVMDNCEKLSKDDGILMRIRRVSEEAIGGIGSLKNNIEESSMGVREVAKHLEDLHDRYNVIKRIGERLRILCLYIGIENSRSALSSTLYKDYVDEMREYSERIISLHKIISSDTERVENEQSCAIEAIAQGVTMMEDLICDAGDVLDEIIQLMDETAEMMAKVQLRAQKIYGRMNEIVTAMQYRDITRQKLEHVVSALGDGVRKALDACSSDHRGSAWQVQLYSLLEIQEAQASEAHAELIRMKLDIEKNLQKIKNDLSLMREISAPHDILSVKKSSSAGESSAIKTSTMRLADIFAKGTSLRQNITDASLHAYELAKSLSTRAGDLQGIGETMGLHAMNAIIKSVRLGSEGRAQEVLAQEVGKLSRGSDGTVNEIIREIACIMAKIESITNVGDDLENEGESAVLWNSEMVSACASFEECDSRRRESLDKANTIDEIAMNALNKVKVLDRLCEGIGSVCSDLRAILYNLRPLCGDIEIKKADLNMSYKRSYTMESERRTHEKISGEGGDFAVKPLKPLDDSNVELF